MINIGDVVRVTDRLHEGTGNTFDLQVGDVGRVESYLDSNNGVVIAIDRADGKTLRYMIDDAALERIERKQASSIKDGYRVTHVRNHRLNPVEVEALVDAKIEEVLSVFPEAQIERLYNKDGFLVGALTGEQQA